MVSHRPLRVALISGSVIRHDAISASVLADARAFSADPRFMVQLFSYCCDAGDVPHRQVDNLTELLLDPFYLASDALIFHFGIYYELFNALLLGNGHGRRIVRYHNVTPPELLPEMARYNAMAARDFGHAVRRMLIGVADVVPVRRALRPFFSHRDVLLARPSSSPVVWGKVP